MADDTVPDEAYATAADAMLELSTHMPPLPETELNALRTRVGQRNSVLRGIVDAVWPMAIAAGRRQKWEELARQALAGDQPGVDETPAIMSRHERLIRAKIAADIRAAVEASPLVAMRGGDVGFGAAQAYDTAATIAGGPAHDDLLVWAVRVSNYEPPEIVAIYSNPDAANQHAALRSDLETIEWTVADRYPEP